MYKRAQRGCGASEGEQKEDEGHDGAVSVLVSRLLRLQSRFLLFSAVWRAGRDGQVVAGGNCVTASPGRTVTRWLRG